jgi:hypothetical protein
MRTREDIEAYLGRSGHPHREVADDTWLVTDPSDGREHIAVRLADGLVLFRLKVLELDRLDPKQREAFFEQVLRMNAEDMVHGAYGVADGDVVITATLRLENLDFSEFSGTLDDFIVAVTNHYPTLREFVRAAH